jgi:hypothetical protein
MSQPPPFQFREAMNFVVSKFEREFATSENIKTWANAEDLAEFKAHLCKCICYSMHQIYNGLENWRFPVFEGVRIARVPLEVRAKRSRFPYVFNKIKRFIMECFEHVLDIGPKHRPHVMSSLDSDTDYFKNQHMTFSLHYKSNYYRFRLEEFGDAEHVHGEAVRYWCFCSPIKLQYEYVY